MASDVCSDFPILGNVWERPFDSDEIEFAVVTANRLAEFVDKWTGTVPDIRFARRRSFFWLVADAYFLRQFVLDFSTFERRIRAPKYSNDVLGQLTTHSYEI